MPLWAFVSRNLASLAVLSLAVAMPVGIADGSRLSGKDIRRPDVFAPLTLRPSIVVHGGGFEGGGTIIPDLAGPQFAELRTGLFAGTQRKVPFNDTLRNDAAAHEEIHFGLVDGDVAFDGPHAHNAPQPVIASMELRTQVAELNRDARPRTGGIEISALRTRPIDPDLSHNDDTPRKNQQQAIRPSRMRTAISLTCCDQASWTKSCQVERPYRMGE